MGIVEKFIKEGQLTREEYPNFCTYIRIRIRFVCFGKKLSVSRRNILEIKYIHEV